MAVTETRLLVLGAVMLFEPVNGYQIRRELLSWGVEDWAHIKPGSIYSALATLAANGHAERHDVTDGGRQVAVYTTTASGREEFQRLHRDAVETVDLLSPLAFHTAVSLVPLVTRSDFEQRLAVRVERLRDELARQTAMGSVARGGMPPHVFAMNELWIDLLTADLRWCESGLGGIRSGAWTFRGEPSDWRPADDDPGWQMAADRERYRDLLAGE